MVNRICKFEIHIKVMIEDNIFDDYFRTNGNRELRVGSLVMTTHSLKLKRHYS